MALFFCRWLLLPSVDHRLQVSALGANTRAQSLAASANSASLVPTTIVFCLVLKQVPTKLNLIVQSCNVKRCFSCNVFCIDVCAILKKNVCAGSRTDLCSSVQRSCPIDWLAICEQTSFEDVAKSLRIVIQNYIMHNWVVIVFHCSYFFSILCAAPVDSITIRMVTWTWRSCLGVSLKAFFWLAFTPCDLFVTDVLIIDHKALICLLSGMLYFLSLHVVLFDKLFILSVLHVSTESSQRCCAAYFVFAVVVRRLILRSHLSAQYLTL